MLGDSPLVKDADEDTKKQSRRRKVIEVEDADVVEYDAETEEEVVTRRKPKRRSRLGVAAFSLGTLAAVQLLKKLRK